MKNNVFPKLSLLSPEQVEQVHTYTLSLLSKTGIRVESPKAREVFASALATVDGERVRIGAEIVEQCLRSTPPAITMYDRKGQAAFRLDGRDPEPHFGIGVTNLWYQDPETDEVVPFTRKHMETAVRLGDALESFELVSTPGVIQDLPSDRSEIFATLEMVANTSKPLVLLVSNAQQFKQSLGLLEHLYGDLSSRPFVVPYFNPVTPLVLNAETTDKIFATIESGLPFIYSNYGMSGTTAPITASGTLVMLNAELLAGLVFAQLIKEGTPVILGSLPAVFEMRSMISTYTPQTMLVNLACAEMMAHYRIPHSGTSGSGTGWGPDLIAGGTLWMNHLSSCFGKAGLVPFVGSNFDSLVFSPTTAVYADEVIRQCRFFAEGLQLDDYAVGLQEIDAIGPGGNFIMAEQTLSLFREVHEQRSRIWKAMSLDRWQEQGSPKAISVLRHCTQELLENMLPPDDHDQLLCRGEEMMKLTV